MNPPKTKGKSGNSRLVEVNAGGGSYLFRVTRHAWMRAIQRNVNPKVFASMIRRVARFIPGAVQDRSRNPTVAIPDPARGAALIVALGPRGGAVVTVLKYPEMVISPNMQVLDARCA